MTIPGDGWQLGLGGGVYFAKLWTLNEVSHYLISRLTYYSKLFPLNDCKYFIYALSASNSFYPITSMK